MITPERITTWRAKYKRGESGYGDDILDLCDEVEALQDVIGNMVLGDASLSDNP